MSRELKDLHPILVDVWQKAEKQWYIIYPDEPKPIITCTNRTNEEQAKLYNSGRTVSGKILTNAKPGQSPHNYLPSYAFDIAFIKGAIPDWRPILFERFAGIVEKISNKILWGGRFKSMKGGDMPHFEVKNWKQLAGK